MKIQWSVFYALFLFVLAGCGAEQFGSVPQSSTSNPNAVSNYSQLSCTSSTLIKPKVDILYVVDNSGSSFYISSQIKQAILNTVGTVSQEFDYRIIGTPLIPDSTPNDDYQVLTNSSDTLPNPGRKIISASELNFFSNPGTQYASEKGLKTIVEFINTSGVIRSNAHLVVVVVSNGRDVEVESDPQGNGNTVQTSVFATRYNSLANLKASPYQLYFYSATAKSNTCGRTSSSSDYATYEGWRKSTLSYVAMADSLPNGTSYDLCTQSVSNIFNYVNTAIQQEVIPHKYRFFPMTFAKASDTRNTFGEIKVYKVSGNSAPQEMTSGWSYYESTSGMENTRELPTVGEPVSGRHFIRFDSLVSYPDCVQIRSVSRTEYFGYIVLPKEPKPETVSVRINGSVISQSSTNGWTYIGNSTKNIKMAFPNAGDDQPAVTKTGYLLQLNGSSNYYKSGDNVEVNYIPAGI